MKMPSIQRYHQDNILRALSRISSLESMTGGSRVKILVVLKYLRPMLEILALGPNVQIQVMARSQF
jgi:hypothetical protein